MTEYRVSIVVEEFDENGDVKPDFVLSQTWTGNTRLMHGLTEAERVMKVLSVSKVPGA